MNRTDIELFKEILNDDAIHFTVAQVVRVTVAKNRSVVTLECTDTVGGHDLVCALSLDSVGMNTASGDLPDPKDLILVAYSNSNINQAYALKRLPSKEEPIPKQMVDGDTVFMARPGKQAHLTSDTQINIGLGDYDNPPDEPLVLGTQLKTLLSDMLTQLAKLAQDVKDLCDVVKSLGDNVNSLAGDLATHQHPSAAPGPPSPPITAAVIAADGVQAQATGAQATPIGSDASSVKSQLNNYKSSPVNDDTILSDLAFTEKGG